MSLKVQHLCPVFELSLEEASGFLGFVLCPLGLADFQTVGPEKPVSVSSEQRPLLLIRVWLL